MPYKASKLRSWTSGEDFIFQTSPARTNTKSRRQTIMKSKEIKRDEPNGYRRRSVYLKKLENDVLNVSQSNSPISRRTRRKSSANLLDEGPIKKTIARSKSEKSMTKRNAVVTETKKPSPKINSPRGRLRKMAVKSSDDLISKDVLYSKSPVKLAAGQRNKDVSASNVVQKKGSVSKQTKKSQPTQKPQETKKTSAVAKASQQKIKKTLKRLESKASTPMSSPPKTKRLTRSAKRNMSKRVSISAQSPAASELFRKTPIVPAKQSYADSEKTSKSRGMAKALLFTPKLDEPYDILKTNLKMRVSTELRAYRKKNPTPLKITNNGSLKTPNGKHMTNGIEGENPEEPAYHLPATPLSSRKSSKFRNGTSDMLSSTPVKSTFNRSKLNFEDHSFDDIRNLSNSMTTGSDLTASFTKSLNGTPHLSAVQEEEEEVEEDMSDVPVPQKTQKKGYCVLM